MVLEIVVGVGDVVLAGIGVLGRHRDAAVLPAHIVGSRRPVEAAAVREAAPRRVDLREVGVVAPVAAVDQLQQPGAVRARFRAENPCGGSTSVTVLGDVGVRVRTNVIRLGRLVEVRDERHRVVEHGDDVREGVPKEAGDPHGDVDTRPAEFGERDRLQVDDTAGCVVPHRPNTQQRKHFGDVVTRCPHGRRPPHRKADRPRPAAVVLAVPGQQRLGHRAAGFPGQPRRHGLRVDRVEVAPGGQHVDQAPQRRARRARGDEPAVQSAQDLIDLSRGARQSGHHLGAREPQDRRHVAVIGQPVDHRGVPAGLLKLGKQCASAGFGLVDRGAIVGAVLGKAERLSQPRHRLLAAEQLSRPQDGQHQVQLGLIGRRLAEYVKPVADLDVLDLAQPAVDVQQHVVERVVLGAFCQAEIAVHLGGAHQRPDLLADRG